jgi:hypothetical protein
MRSGRGPTGLRRSFCALFTQVRGIGILRTSPFGDSPKFAKNNALNGTKFIGDLSGVGIHGSLHAHPCAAKKANPLRSGGAKPMGLLES